MDLTYQTQLRELNELNWERFKTTLQAEIATLRGELRVEMHAMGGELRSEMHAMRGDLRSEMHALHKDLIRWMFVFWCGNMLGLGGLIVAVARLR